MSLEVFQDPSVSAFNDVRLAGLLRYWQELRDGARLPSRTDVEPQELGTVLPWTFLIDVTPLDGFRYRLVGTAIVQEMGYDMTGQLVARAYAGPDWDQIRRDYDWVIRERRPCLTRNRVMLPANGSEYCYSRLLLPLATDGENVDILLGAAIADNQSLRHSESEPRRPAGQMSP